MRHPKGAVRAAKALLQRTLTRDILRVMGPSSTPVPGRVDFGDFRRTRPIDARFGFHRGQPVDRYYIERFLASQATDIRGRVLEVGDAGYTRMFDDGRVDRSDILDIVRDNPVATIIADLSAADDVPSGVFDCIILTQTLQYVYDIPTAVAELHRMLAPGGVLLATVPGISQIDHEHGGPGWCWNFTPRSLRLSLERQFSPGDVSVESHGNVMAAIAFLEGLASHELEPAELDYHDPSYPVSITARAARAGESMRLAEVSSQIPSSPSPGQAARETKRRRPDRADGESRDGQLASWAGPTGGLVLLYHRAAQLAIDPWTLAVTPEHLAQHLDVLARHTRPTTIAELDRDDSGRRKVERDVVVTFDDGYADLASVVRPILDRAGIPAAMFIVTDALDADGEFWWDSLERVFLAGGRLPAQLRLTVGDSNRTWNIPGDDNPGTTSNDDGAPPTGRVHSEAHGAPVSARRMAVFREVWDALRVLNRDDRYAAVADLLVWAGLTRIARPTHRLLSAADIAVLAADPLIEIGAHTVSHPSLRGLSAEDQRWEIVEGRRRLEAVIGREVDRFAYPHGSLADVGPVTLAAAQEAGFRSAFMATPNRGLWTPHRFAVPRLRVGDVDGDAFGQLLRRVAGIRVP